MLLALCFYLRTQNVVPLLRRLVAGLPPQKHIFTPGQSYVGFVMDEVELGQVFLQFLLFYLVIIIPPRLHTHVSSGV
jgi:hypothetical protein